MSEYPASSIPLSSNIGTTDIADVFPTHLDYLGYGGHRSVADDTARDAITTERRSFGMLVATQDQNPAVVYMLCDIAMGGVSDDLFDNGNWLVFATGSSTTVFVDNEIVPGSTNTFTLTAVPITGSEHIYAVGQRLYPTTDYSISGAVITTVNPWDTGDILADYRK